MRNIKNINENWVFVKENEKSTVNLPHTWNGIDGQDGGNDYYRGKCTYIKEIAKADMPQGEEIYLQLDGVNSSAFVYFNSKLVCTHHGGYSTFRVKLENIKDNNEIKIEADNSPNDFVYPQQADFTFYGGIYRDVTLIGVEKNHFDLDYYGAPGIQITPVVNGDKADVNVKTYITGGGEVRVTVNGETKTGTEVDFIVDNPHLWNGVVDPYLYNAVAELIVDGEVVDRVESRFGIRSFKVDPQKGFILNGKPYPLRGVSRHQDRPGIGNALLPEHHREDIELICEMGANTIRLAHYQHAQYFYDLCDEKGLVVWAEIPYISSHLEKGVENTKTQMTELIAQNYNHPCIVTWGLSNEITMSGASPAVVENHKMLNDLVHSMDKTRPTTEAVVTMCSMDNEYVHISDIVSYNHYFGWYGGNVNMYGPWFDKFHEKYPDKAIGISEYGCEALNWHATDIVQGDYTEEYQAYYHEELIKQIAVRPYLWATHVWNMFDFAADARAEGGENGMNHKGLVTFDRKYKKDSFYAYQAWLSDKPMLHICSKRYIDRVEDKVKIKVYSNQDEVELFANGESVGVQKKGEFPFFTFEVKNEGETILTAKAGDLTDESKIRKVGSFNEDYRMKEEGAVINWFEINTPVGYYSVNDTIGDIMESFRGKLAMLKIGAMLLKVLKGDSQPSDEPKKKKSKGASVMGFKPSKEMLQLGYGFTVKRVISMLGGKFTKEQILKINAILNKVKKPKK
ncbi:glycoside hydrolase family 2 TIM barrel-domain containing protein [uncultured Eubacterium sp.]|uniref:glycoside hydrolase family 2 protein n=1 Tax=uncultured Eubacterium sp. TaxID=165185 RepID=UPI0026157562|nr:glycoside hydrolase family 2 TIM barrel-domain containing protein [uncultured Eubacterium sp.]